MTREADFISTCTTVINTFNSVNQQQQGKALFGDLKHSEIEMIALIGELSEPNVITLAKESNMTKGGITKLVNKFNQSCTKLIGSI